MRNSDAENIDDKITFPPTSVVRIDPETLQRLHEEGVAFRREIERRSRTMFVPSCDCSRRRCR